MSKDDELVLCLEEAQVDDLRDWVDRPHFTRLDTASMSKLLNLDYVFKERRYCENDPKYKQLIPYICFVNSGEALMYSRTKDAGEERLHGKCSVGVGGHINECDQRPSLIETVEAAIDREIREEVTIDYGGTYEFQYGLIYDPTNDVGKVHIGLLVVAKTKDKRVTSNEQGVFNPAYKDLDALNGPLYCDLENWSRVAVRELKDQYTA